MPNHANNLTVCVYISTSIKQNDNQFYIKYFLTDSATLKLCIMFIYITHTLAYHKVLTLTKTSKAFCKRHIGQGNVSLQISTTSYHLCVYTSQQSGTSMAP